MPKRRRTKAVRDMPTPKSYFPGSPNSPEENVQTSPSKLTNHALLNHPSLFEAGLGMINGLTQEEATKVIEKRVSPRTRGRDINSSLDNKKNSDNGNQQNKNTPVSSTDNNDTEKLYGNNLLNELFTRIDAIKKDDSKQMYDPDLDVNGDNSNGHITELNASDVIERIIGGKELYQERKGPYELHSKNVQNLTEESLLSRFEEIKGELKDIAEGYIESKRHDLYYQGLKKINKLKELRVNTPFNANQGSFLLMYINDFIFPNKMERMKWLEYTESVMLPEAFIRIYSRLNDLSYEMSENELRFGLLY